VEIATHTFGPLPSIISISKLPITCNDRCFVTYGMQQACSRIHFSQLIEAFSAERFPELRDRLEREFYAYERFTNRQWEIETNARLYGPR